MKINIPIPIKMWKVKSKSEANTYYMVGLSSDGTFQCSCTAGKFNRECRHKQLAKEQHAKK